MSLTDLTSGLRSLNMCGFPIPTGNYKLFVQAVGKPTMSNQISGALSYRSSCGGGGAGSSSTSALSFNAAPATVTIAAGTKGGVTVSAKAQTGAFNARISLSCAGIPVNLSCSFSPATIVPGSGVATSALTISAASVTGMNLPHRNQTFPIYAGLLLPFGIGGFFFVGSAPRRRKVQFLSLIAVVSIGIAGTSCGGNSVGTQHAATPAASGSSYTITINGNTSSSLLSTTVNVVVR
jgi:hypothetical protein